MLSDCRSAALVTSDGVVDLRRWTRADGGAFVLASFWLAECHARAGRLDGGHPIFGRAARDADPLGLLAEELHPRAQEPPGTIPHAIAHVGVINSASALTGAEDGAKLAA